MKVLQTEEKYTLMSVILTRGSNLQVMSNKVRVKFRILNRGIIFNHGNNGKICVQRRFHALGTLWVI